MMDPAELQELETLGEESQEPVPRRKPGAGVLLAQGLLCVLLLVGLVGGKLLAPEIYARFTDWYHRESARQVPLPEWLSPSSSGALAPEPTPSPLPSVPPGTPRQV